MTGAAAFARAHILGQQRLRALVGNGVARAWESLPGYDEKDVPRFLAVVLPLVLAGQRQSVSLTDAFLARSLGRQPLGVDPAALSGAAVRNGTPPAEVFTRPFIGIWAALTAGTLWRDAVNAGQARAVSAAEMDIALSSRETLREVGRQDSQITTYQRVADAGACDFCLACDGAYLKAEDALPLHNNCGCSVEVVMEDRAATPTPDGVGVADHGELGPLLVDPSEHFKTL